MLLLYFKFLEAKKIFYGRRNFGMGEIEILMLRDK